MAIKRLYSTGSVGDYGQIELTQVIFTVDGRIEAQLPYVNANGTALENGMLVAVDHAANQIRLPGATEACPIGIHYSAEIMYDSRDKGLKNFCLKPNVANTGSDRLPLSKLNDADFYPRVGYLSVGEKFITDTVCYDTEEFDDADAVELAIKAAGTTALYGGISTTGAILLSNTAPTAGPVLKVVKKFKLANGEDAIKFAVIAE